MATVKLVVQYQDSKTDETIDIERVLSMIEQDALCKFMQLKKWQQVFIIDKIEAYISSNCKH